MCSCEDRKLVQKLGKDLTYCTQNGQNSIVFGLSECNIGLSVPVWRVSMVGNFRCIKHR